MSTTTKIKRTWSDLTADERAQVDSRTYKPTVLVREGRWRFEVGHVAEGDEGRQEIHGPMVPGPWAYAFGLCTVLHDGPADEPEDRLDVSEGDLLQVGEHVYRVRFVRNQWLALDLVGPAE